MPRVSIGLPVYNGERYIEEAINSILAQTFEDFELIISDNASTDRTEDICRAYAAKDERIRYFRNTENLGAARNFNRVVELASGEYFKWVSHDDICGPDFLLKCVNVLDQVPSAVLCYPRAADIDDKGRFLRPKDYAVDVQSFRRHRRFRDLTRLGHGCLHVFGLIRMEVLKKTALIGNYPGSDQVLLAELSLWGKFYEVPETLFLHREHPLRSAKAQPTLHSRAGWFDPKKNNRIVFPAWRLFVEFLLSITRPPLSRRQRAACYVQLPFWMAWHWKMLMNDPVVAARQIFTRFRGTIVV